MIATILTLSQSDCKAVCLADRYSVHKVVYSLFPKQEESTREFLFRDQGGDYKQRKILILSKSPPQKPLFGEITSRIIPESFLQYNHYAFDVTLNPVSRDSASRKVLPVKGKTKLLELFTQKSSSWGFSSDVEALQVYETDVIQFVKKGTMCTYGSASFWGSLTVTDRDLFIHSFTHGIGKGKGFGFGLMQIVPVMY